MTPHLPPPKDKRPKRFPPPEFPPRRPSLFAKTPPAIFPAILGLLGLTIALRLSLQAFGIDQAPADLLAGVAVSLWAFAAMAYAAKMARRPAVVNEDLRVLPGRSGLSAMTIGAMAAAMIVLPYSQTVATVLVLAGLAGHLVLAALLVRLLISLPAAGREVNPTWHLSFVGIIVILKMILSILQCLLERAPSFGIQLRIDLLFDAGECCLQVDNVGGNQCIKLACFHAQLPNEQQYLPN